MRGKQNIVGNIILILFLTVLPLIMHRGFLDITQTKMWTYIIFTVCYVAFCVLFCIRNKKKYKNSIFTILLIIWAVIVAFSCVLSEAGKFSWSGIGGRNNGGILLLSYVIVALCLVNVGELKKAHVYALLVTGTLIAVLGIANNLGIDPIGTLSQIVPQQRQWYVSTIGQIDIYVSFFAVVLPISIYNIWYEKRIILKVVNAFFSVIYIVAMLASKCDSVYITLFVMVFAYGICLMKKHKGFCLIPIGAVAAFVLFMAKNPSLLVFNDDWGNHRGFIWNQGMDYFVHAGFKDKLIGIGPDSVGLVFHWHYGITGTMIESMTYDNLHNLYLQILVTTGVLGLAVFLALCTVAIYSLLKMGYLHDSRDNYALPIAIAAVCYLAQSVVNISSPATLGVLIVLVALGQRTKICRERCCSAGTSCEAGKKEEV